MEKLKTVKDYKSFCMWIKNKLESAEIKSCYDIKTCEYLDELIKNGFDKNHIRILLKFMEMYLSDPINNPNKAEVEKHNVYRQRLSTTFII